MRGATLQKKSTNKKYERKYITREIATKQKRERGDVHNRKIAKKAKSIKKKALYKK